VDRLRTGILANRICIMVSPALTPPADRSLELFFRLIEPVFEAGSASRALLFGISALSLTAIP
jgi:hypothetical protein